MSRKRLLALLVAPLIQLGTGSQAAGAENAAELDWVPLDELTPEQQAQVEDNCCGLYVQTPLPAESESNLSSRTASYPDENTIVLEGNVESYRDGVLVRGDQAVYDRNTEVLDVNGNVRVRQQNLLITGTSALSDRVAGVSTLDDASYLMHETGIHGAAGQIVYDERTGRIRITDGAFSRCEPVNPVWELKATTLQLNQDTGRGYAWNTTLRIKNIPVFYSPWFSFPITDERMSGFLMPSLGSSDNGGIDLTTPYYLNLAPNADATYIPRYQSDHGLQHGGEVRFLGSRHREEVNFTWLGDDEEYDPEVLAQIEAAEDAGDTDLLDELDSAPTDDRWMLNWQHQGRWGERWTSMVDYRAVSDMEYFEDYGTNGLRSNNQSYINRRARLSWDSPQWSFTTDLLGYQYVDPLVNELAYDHDKLPSFTLDGDFSTPFGIDYGLTANYTLFDLRLDPDDYSQATLDSGRLVEGSRLHLTPEISYTWSTPGIFVTPGFKYQYTSYDLDRERVGTDASPDRGVATGTLDAGLIFERDLSLFGSEWQQTLEPRLYYLYTDYEDQDELPVFDTAFTTFSASQLFRDDRFSGSDRIGDANQVTMALTSRLLDSSGRQKASGSIGQILYLEDRRVTLSGRQSASDTRNTSTIVADGRWNVSPEWAVAAYLEHNPSDNTVDVGSASLRFQPDEERLFNLSLRFRDDGSQVSRNPDLDPRIIQSDVSATWPLNEQWSFFARLNYDHANNRTLETLAGFEFDSCCWATRIAYREWIDQEELRRFNDGSYNYGVFFEFELKGFGGVLGNRVGNILQDSINGYTVR